MLGLHGLKKAQMLSLSLCLFSKTVYHFIQSVSHRSKTGFNYLGGWGNEAEVIFKYQSIHMYESQAEAVSRSDF